MVAKLIKNMNSNAEQYLIVTLTLFNQLHLKSVGYVTFPIYRCISSTNNSNHSFDFEIADENVTIFYIV